MSEDKSIFRLPQELQLLILSNLPAKTLLSVAQTCQYLRLLALDDTVWCALVQENVPFKLPAACPSFPSWREAYINLYPCWFLARQRLWISNHEIAGGLVVARYILAKNQIELWHLAVRTEESSYPSTQWQHDGSVMIFDFRPIIESYSKLFPNSAPLLRIPHPSGTMRRDPDGKLVGMGALQFAKDLPQEAIGPTTAVWPPQVIPAPGRTRNMSINNYRSIGHCPQKLSEVSENVFRLLEVSSLHRLGLNTDLSRRNDLMETYGTICQEAYTPTKNRPFRGIWVGDYNGHGAEYVIFLQPDNKYEIRIPRDATEEIERLSEEDATQHPAYDINGFDEDRFPGSRLEGSLLGVKITGDINVPKGEFTFIVRDIGTEATLRIAEEEPFRGARVVRGVGHVAGLLLSHGKLFHIIHISVKV
jgi:Cyclin D1 binding domain/F-box-like